MRRTSVKAGVAAVVLFVIYVVTLFLAESYYRNPNPITFSGGHGRPWNVWDYIGLSSAVLAVSLTIAAWMFAEKED